jgi:hypothetical protein
MKFDWYQATVEEPPLWLRSHLPDGVEDDAEWQEVRPLRGYARAEAMYVGGAQLLAIHSGGSHEFPHVVATGSAADDAARLVRNVAPKHLVARADVCEDLQAPGWFDHAFGVMVDVALERNVKPMRQGDWDSPKPSRTMYLGSPSSAVRVRCYEKGVQLRGEYGPAAAAVIPEDWVRLEVQVRPAKREQKLMMAAVPAAEWWGCSRYSQELADRLLGVSAPRSTVGTIWRDGGDLDRALHHLVRGYANSLRNLHGLHGSWEAVGVVIGQELERRA